MCSLCVVCFVRVCCRDVCVRVYCNFILFTRHAPGAFPFVLLVRFAETCVLADPAAVDEFCLHVFSSCSLFCSCVLS